MSILDEIISTKRLEVENARQTVSLHQIQAMAYDSEVPSRSLRRNMDVDKRFHYICEIKKASPSCGIIQPDFNPLRQAQRYYEAGADALSILTDRIYFHGSPEHLRQVRACVDLPILRKDFIIDRYQIYESRLIGADLILLIARILSRQQIADFAGLASKLKLEVLIELADEMDVEKIPAATDSIILGVNNRNLHNFEVTVENSIYLQPFLPIDIPAISESGIHTAEQCRILYEKGFRGVLIGEALMRAESPQKLLMEFRNGVQNAMQA